MTFFKLKIVFKLYIVYCCSIITFMFVTCFTGISINDGLWHAHCLLCDVQLNLLNYTDAEQSASTALELLKNKNKDEPVVQHMLLKALSFSDQSDDWDRASELLRQVSAENCSVILQGLIVSQNLILNFVINQCLNLHGLFYVSLLVYNTQTIKRLSQI